MVDAVKKYAGVDFDQIKTLEEARAIAKEKGVEFEPRHKKGDILSLFFEEFAEEHLIQPTFVPVSYTHLHFWLPVRSVIRKSFTTSRLRAWRSRRQSSCGS